MSHGSARARLLRALAAAALLALACTAQAQPAGDTEAAQKQSVADYQAGLAQLMATTKRYPPEAMQHHQQGTTLLHVAIGADGELSEVTIEKSSGHAALDEAAMLAARQARARMVVPANLRGIAFAAHVQVSFSLDPAAPVPRATP